jgi:hypothetical protein
MDYKWAIEKGIPFADGQLVAVSTNRYQLRSLKPPGA